MAQHKNIDIIPDSTVNRIHLSQGDIGRTLIFYLFENALSWSVPSNSTIKCQGTKPSGFGFSASCTYSGNAVTCVTTDEMTDEYGQIEAELVITSSDESQVFGTSNFILDIEKNPHPDGTVDGDAENPVIANLEAVITQAVDGWLDEHPEATTTVVDGSLTEAKFSEALKLATIKDYVTPEMFGAKGDGVTDDLSALESMIADVSEGQLIYFPKGTYLISDSWFVNKSGLTLLFNDEAVLKMTTASTVGGILCLYDKDYYSVKDLTLIGGHFSTTFANNNENAISTGLNTKNIKIIGVTIDASSNHGITTQHGTEGLLIKDCVIKNCVTSGISIQQNEAEYKTNDVVVDNCRIENCNNYGIGVYVGTNNVVIRNCSYRNSTGTFIYANQADFLEVDNCYSDGAQYFITLSECTECIVDGCCFDGATYDGITLNGAERVVINNSNIEATRYAVNITGGAGYTQLQHLTISNSKLKANYGTYGAKKNFIAIDNSFFDCVEASVYNYYIDGGHISGNYLKGKIGVYFNGNTSPFSVSDNKIETTTYGIQGVSSGSTLTPIAVGNTITCEGTALQGWTPRVGINWINGVMTISGLA